MNIAIIKRASISFLLLLAMSFVTFWFMHATPGNFFDSLKLNPQISPETIQHYEEIYHLKDPLVVQYSHWLFNVFHGEFGYSFYYNVPVVDVIGPRLWNTFVLSLSSLILTWGLAIPLGGMHAANYEDLSGWMKWIDLLKHLVIPTTVLSLASIASLQRVMRGNMLAQLRQQYILAARAKGLPEDRIIYIHALRNAFNPMVTLLGYEFASLLSGAALVEIVCSWPGLGALMLTAVRSKDVYVVMASMLMGGVLLLLGNLLADYLLLKLDPRIVQKDDKNV